MFKSEARAIISFTTDFGTKDGYTGIVKGVILSIAPSAQIVDLSHDVPSGDRQAAAWIIDNAWRHFPRGSVHLVIVDPMVGSKQKRIALTNGEHTFVGPDNGVFSLVLRHGQHWQAYELTNHLYFKENVSTTFHGRDIFGPVAAHLSIGICPSSLGESIDANSLHRLPLAEASKIGDTVEGAVVFIDKYGNLITNIPARLIETGMGCAIEQGDTVPVLITYSSVEGGQVTAFKGSHGFLEIAVNGGSAEQRFNAAIGARVTLSPGREASRC
jgi:S-adenosylmethionine hydrolase